jgi:putative membrane protein
MGWWHHGWLLGLGGGEWWLVLIMGLLMLLFWGGLIALLFVAIRAAVGPGSNQAPSGAGAGEALAVLARRYARGEINADEYKEMKEVLHT